MNTFYFRVECNPPRCSSYSLPILIETTLPGLTVGEVVSHCILNKEFHRDSDAEFIKSVNEIDYPEYQDLIRESLQ